MVHRTRSGHTPIWRTCADYSAVLLLPFLKSDLVKRYVLAPQIADACLVSKAVEVFSRRFRLDDLFCENEPVFIFSAGWGSGSTLLQRLLMSSDNIVVWGEPLDEAAPIHRLGESIMPVRDEWPPQRHFLEGVSEKDLSSEWIANLVPDMRRYVLAHREFLIKWLSWEGKRWGIKEVRLTIDHAVYLKWLFPGAKFLFLYRDVFDSYLSVRRKSWLSVWPDYRATNIVAFAHHWNHLVDGYLTGCREVDGMLVKYEDLVAGRVTAEDIRAYTGLSDIDASVLKKQIGGRSKDRKPLIFVERKILTTICQGTRELAGYA